MRLLTPEEWAAQIWTRPENSNRIMDEQLCLSIAQSLRELLENRSLGGAQIDLRLESNAKRNS